MGKIYVIGIGPGNEGGLTIQAKETLNACDIIAGYKAYTALIKPLFPNKEYYENGMGGEIERCKKCVSFANEGKNVALVCSGDPEVYGMASPLLEVAEEEGFSDIEIIPGVTSALSCGAILGAPLNHDFCIISLSDLLTPWEVIEKRLKAAAEGDFVIALYNPSSKNRKDYLKRACEILLETLDKDTKCGYVKNAGREGEEKRICTLFELMKEEVDMFTTVFIGNGNTKILNGKLVTPRGYFKE